MKRKIIILVIIVLLPLVFFNGYKLKVYKEFGSYLHKNYAEKTFYINWVKYDFLNKTFVSKVHCSDDGTDFTISKHSSIEEQYLLKKNMKPIDSIIKSYLKNNYFNGYIQDLIAGVEDEEILDTNKEIDYSKLVYHVFIQYKYNSIIDNQDFAEISYKVIQELKKSGVKMSLIGFEYERGNKVFSLLLQGENINGHIANIAGLIERRK